MRVGALAVALGAALAAAGDGNAEEGRMEITEIRYRSTVPDELYPDVLVIHGSGRATFTRGTNASGGVVGVFEGLATAADIERIAADLSSPELDAVKFKPILPGSPVRSFRVTWRDGRVLGRAVPRREQTPPAFAAAEKAALAVAEDVARNAVRALEVRLVAVAYRGLPARLEVELELVNAGKATLRLPAPGAEGGTAIAIEVLRDGPDGPDQDFVEVKPAYLKGPAAEGGVLVLAPGATARLAIKQKARLKAGVNRLGAQVRTVMLDDAGGVLLRCEVRSAELELKV